MSDEAEYEAMEWKAKYYQYKCQKMDEEKVFLGVVEQAKDELADIKSELEGSKAREKYWQLRTERFKGVMAHCSEQLENLETDLSKDLGELIDDAMSPKSQSEDRYASQ